MRDFIRTTHSCNAHTMITIHQVCIQYTYICRSCTWFLLPQPHHLVMQTVMVRLQAGCDGGENRIEDCRNGVTKALALVAHRHGCTANQVRRGVLSLLNYFNRYFTIPACGSNSIGLALSHYYMQLSDTKLRQLYRLY